MIPRLVRILVALSATALVSACSQGVQQRSAQLNTGGVLQGFVRDSSGTPLRYARVRLVASDLASTADSTGCYRIEGIPPGTHAVRAAFVGYRPQEIQNVKISAGKTTLQDLVLTQTRVEITETTNIEWQSGSNRADSLRSTRAPTTVNPQVQTNAFENASISVDTSKPAPQFGSAGRSTQARCR